MARTLIRSVEHARHIGPKPVSDSTEEKRQSRIIRPLTGPAARGTHPPEISKIRFHRDDQLRVWSSHRAYLRVGRAAVSWRDSET